MKTLLKSATIILVVLFFSYWLFADQIIKSQAEKALSDAHGAEVNIGDLSHSLWPTRVTASNIAFTDPYQPQQNQIQMQQLFADVEFLPLLSGRFIAENVQIEELSFGQARDLPGVVYRVPAQQQTFGFPTPDNLPTVDELLAHSPLQTTAAAQQAKETYEKHAINLQNRYQALPDKAALDAYKAEWQALKETDFRDPEALLAAQKQFEQLKQKVLTDRQNISEFSEATQIARSELSDAASALKAAPAQDYQLLQGLVAGDQAAIAEISQRLFGQQAAEYSRYLTFAVQTLAPMLSGQSSETPQKKALSPDTIPQVWIKQASVSVRYRDQLISSDWQNIIDNHLFIQEPTTFNVSASEGPWWQSLITGGQFEIDANGIQAIQEWQIDGLAVEQLGLSDSKRLTAQIISTLVNTAGSLSIKDDNLEGQSTIDLGQLRMQADGNDPFTQTIASALTNLSTLNIQLDLTGSLQQPVFNLRSDLDNQLAGQLVSHLTGEQEALLNQLNQSLNEQAAGPVASAETQLQQLQDWQTSADQDTDALNTILNGQLNNVVEQQKNKLLDKLKQKLGGNSG